MHLKLQLLPRLSVWCYFCSLRQLFLFRFVSLCLAKRKWSNETSNFGDCISSERPPEKRIERGLHGDCRETESERNWTKGREKQKDCICFFDLFAVDASGKSNPPNESIVIYRSFILRFIFSVSLSSRREILLWKTTDRNCSSSGLASVEVFAFHLN